MEKEHKFTSFWLRSSAEREGITDSLLLGSGVEVFSAMIDNKYDIFLRSCGDVRIYWKETAYRDVSQFPDELIDVIKEGKLGEHPDAYVDMNNWYELFVYDEKNTCIYSDLCDVDISVMTEQEARAIALEALGSALENIEN